MLRSCTVNGSSPMMDIPGAWLSAEWDPENITFDIGDLGNKSARVVWASAFPHDPLIIGKCYENSEERHNLTGTLMKNLQAICWDLHLRCKVYLAPFGLSSNDSLNGVLGDLGSGKAQVGVAAYSINSDRAAHFDIHPSPFTRSFDVLIHEKNAFFDRSTTLLESLVHLLSPPVWGIAMTLFVIYTILLSLSGVLRTRVRSRGTRMGSLAHELLKWPMELLGSSINTFDMTLNTATASRPQLYLGTVWLLWTVIITNLFASQLPSVLTTSRQRAVPFESMEELDKSDFTVYGTPNIKFLLQSHRKPAFQSIGSKLIPIVDVPPDQYNGYVVERLESGKVAVLISSDSYHELAAISCGLMVAIPNLFSSLVSGLVFPKNSSLRSDFVNVDVARFRTGATKTDNNFFDMFKLRYKIRKCIPRLFSTNSESSFSSFTLTDFSAILVLWFLGLMVAGFVVAVEHIYMRLLRYFRTARPSGSD